MNLVPASFSTEDLELIEQACRALADRYRRDAEAHVGPHIAGEVSAARESDSHGPWIGWSIEHPPE